MEGFVDLDSNVVSNLAEDVTCQGSSAAANFQHDIVRGQVQILDNSLDGPRILQEVLSKALLVTKVFLLHHRTNYYTLRRRYNSRNREILLRDPERLRGWNELRPVQSRRERRA